MHSKYLAFYKSDQAKYKNRDRFVLRVGYPRGVIISYERPKQGSKIGVREISISFK